MVYLAFQANVTTKGQNYLKKSVQKANLLFTCELILHIHSSMQNPDYFDNLVNACAKKNNMTPVNCLFITGMYMADSFSPGFPPGNE